MVEDALAEAANSSGSAALAGVVGRIVAGKRGEQLLAGLDSIDTAIATELLQRLGNQPDAGGGP